MGRERTSFWRGTSDASLPLPPSPLDSRFRTGRRDGTPRALAGVAFLVALCPLASVEANAQTTLRYRAEHLFTLPVEMSRAMLAFGSPKDWRHFPEHTRYIDSDGDGEHDFIAIALGARGGYGAQIRYRLDYAPGRSEARLGDWYWSVVTGPENERLFESFNP